MPRPPVMPASPAGRGRRRGSGRGAFDVGVEVAQQLALRDQWRDQARALVDRVRPVGSVPQARGAGPACLREPRGDRMEQRPGILALRQQRAGDAQAIRAAQHQQHALGAAEMRCFVDQRLVQGVAVAKRVQAQAGVDQALNEFARRRRARGAQVTQRNALASVPRFLIARRAVASRALARWPPKAESATRPVPLPWRIDIDAGRRRRLAAGPGTATLLLFAMSREWAYPRCRWVEVRRRPVGRAAAPALPQMSHGLARHGQEIQPYHVRAPGGGSPRLAATASGRGTCSA